jgi:hypothetical protein
VKAAMPGYEKRKVLIDLLKHFSTLSIGVLALSAAFIGNISKLANSSEVITFAVVSFFIVIISSSIAKYILVANIETMPYGSFSHYLLRWCIIFTFIGFFTGAGSFVYLVVQNT